MPDLVLVPGVLDSGSFGNNFDGRTDADGLITAEFQNAGSDLVLSLTGFDIDFENEVEARLNGNLLGNLAVGPNNSFNTGDSFDIPLSRQLSGTNEITFEQMISDSYKWGVTDILLDTVGPAPADLTLSPGVLDARSFGNRFDGNSDADGVIRAAFENTGTDLVFSLDGYDVDFADEIEVLLNGNSLGFLAQGPNEAFNAGDSFAISAGDQVAGTNILTIQQAVSPTYVWGFANALLQEEGEPGPDTGTVVTTLADIVAADGELSLREAIANANANPGLDTITFDASLGSDTIRTGRGFRITDDLIIDGGPTAQSADAIGFGIDFDGTPAAFLLDDDTTTTFRQFGISGHDGGDLEASVNWTPEDYFAGEVISGRFANIAFDRSALTFNSGISGEYTYHGGAETIGSIIANDSLFLQNSGSLSGAFVRVTDSRVETNFGSTAISGDDVIVETSFVGNNSYGGISGSIVSVSDSTVADNSIKNMYAVPLDQAAGISADVLMLRGSTVTGNSGYLAPGGIAVSETAQIENSIILGNVVAGSDGDLISPEAASLSDIVLGSSGPIQFDDNGRNVVGEDSENLFGGGNIVGATAGQIFADVTSPIQSSVGEPIFAGLATDNGGDTFTVALLDDPANPAIDTADPGDAGPSDQRGLPRSGDGPDIGAFELQQEIVPQTTDIVLGIGQLDTTDYGNRFNGTSDADGVITAGFISNGTDLDFFIVGYDIDYTDEVVVELNGERIGSLSVGPNEGFNAGDTFRIAAADQNSGENVISIIETGRPTYVWGFTDLLLEEVGPPGPDTGTRVTTLVDEVAADGELSLREAVANANARAGLDTITFDPSLTGQSLILENGSLDVTDNLVIDGSTSDGGAASLTIDFNQTASGFNLVGDVSVRAEDLTFRNLRDDIESPLAQSRVFEGSAFKGTDSPSVSSLELMRTLFTDNVFSEGEEVAYTPNIAGVHTVRMEDSAIIDTSGGIAYGLDIRVENSVIQGNRGNSPVIGSASGNLDQGTISIYRSSILDNIGGYNVIVGQNVEIANSTIAGNAKADSQSQAGRGYSGAVSGDVVSVAQSTITGNVGNVNVPGAVYARSSLDLSNSILTGNYRTDPNYVASNVEVALGATIISNGRNIVTTDDGTGFLGTDILNAEAGELFADVVAIGPSGGTGGLALDNGGGLPTVALLDNTANLAIDNADPATASATDQRGELRSGAGPDIGSFELQQSSPITADIALTIGAVDSTDYGNRFNGTTDADGVITAGFISTGTNLDFSLRGFDIDYENEVVVELNGNQIGSLGVGPNEGLNGGDTFRIDASDQIGGENVISIIETGRPTYVWGFTDLLLQEAGEPPPPPPVDADIALTIGVVDSTDYGNRFNGTSDADGVITVGFVSTGEDLDFSLRGFDIDYVDEVVVELNGARIGSLSQGPNEGLNGGDTFRLDAADLLDGENVLSIVETGKPTYVWGFTDLLLEEADSGALAGNALNLDDLIIADTIV